MFNDRHNIKLFLNRINETLLRLLLPTLMYIGMNVFSHPTQLPANIMMILITIIANILSRIFLHFYGVHKMNEAMAEILIS